MLKRRDAAVAAVARFQARDDAAAFVAQLRTSSSGGCAPATMKPPSRAKKRRLGTSRLFELVASARQRGDAIDQIAARVAHFARRGLQRIVELAKLIAQRARCIRCRRADCRDRADRRVRPTVAPARARYPARGADPRATCGAVRCRRRRSRPRRDARAISRDIGQRRSKARPPIRARRPPSPCGRSRRAGCRARSPRQRLVSSRLRRVAASMPMKARSARCATAAAARGSLPFCVSSR